MYFLFCFLQLITEESAGAKLKQTADMNVLKGQLKKSYDDNGTLKKECDKTKKSLQESQKELQEKVCVLSFVCLYIT